MASQMEKRQSKYTHSIVKSKPQLKPEDITIDALHRLSDDSFAMWTQTSGATVDGNRIRFDDYRYLLPIYLCEDEEIVWRKAAQLGATSYMMLRLLWWCEKNQGKSAGLYMPTRDLADITSQNRLSDVIDSCPTIKAIYQPDRSKLALRRIGASSLYVFHLGGQASKDSVPMQLMAFDEVRLCNSKDIDQALERMSASKYKPRIYMSTAGLPGADIDQRFQDGTRHTWRSKCGCPDGVDLAATFPDCVVDDRKRNEVYYQCPKCKWKIVNPQNGRYVAQDPTANYTSFHVSQLASMTISPREVWDVYKRTTNKEEFYNAKLGMPWVDEQNRGVTLEQLEACVDPELSWAEPGKKEGITAMGIDQGNNYLYVMIADIDPKYKNKKRIRHIEIIERHNPRYYGVNGPQSPWVRAHQLMKEYQVDLALVDWMPGYDKALEFCKAFPKKAFLAMYNPQGQEIVQWLDRPQHKQGVKKAGDKFKFKHSALLGRYLSLTMTLSGFRQQEWAIPNPDALIQVCTDEKTGQLRPHALGREKMFIQLNRYIKRFVERNPDTKEGKYEWVFSGEDHFTHAANYCNMALERLSRRAVFTFAGD